MEAYLDNSATTKCTEAVKNIVVKTMMEDYGNPSSKHKKGVEAERYIREAQEMIAGSLKVNKKEIYFTSGGTESDNWAIIGTAMANQRAGKHIVTTSVEHPAVLQSMIFLREQGFEITYLPVDRYGRILLKDLEAAIREDTILVSVMYVNNEIGAVEPVREIGDFLKKNHSNILFHVDAIQAYGKYRIFPKKLGIDLLSVSGHKIHGPKGIGFLYIGENVKIRPLILGGGQQKGMRSGTDHVSGIAGLKVAVEEIYQNFDEDRENLLELKEYFMTNLKNLPEVVLNSLPKEEGAPHIVSASFPGVRSEVLLHALEEKMIYVSSGSACSSNKKLPISTVLKEIGLKKELLDATLRFSFSAFTTKEELDYCLEILGELLPMLRKFARY